MEVRTKDKVRQKQLPDTEVLKIFPEAKQIIKALIKEKSQHRAELVEAIAKELKAINANSNEDYRYFWRSWLKLTQGADLLEEDKHLARLHRQLRIIKGVAPKFGQLNEDLIQTAQEVPLESLLNQQFRRSGRNLVGLCPMHEERTASFHIYTAENRGWCFGCNKGGDVIDIARLMHGYSFKEAVMFLVGGGRP